MNRIYNSRGNYCEDKDFKSWLVSKAEAPLAELLYHGRVILTIKKDSDGVPKSRVACEIDGMPSQCGVCSFHNWIAYDPPGEALEEHWKKCEALAKGLNYTKAMVTLVRTDLIKGLLELGFKDADQFKNKRSGNIVHIMTKDIA